MTAPTIDRNVEHDISDSERDRFAHIVVPAGAVTESYITGSTVTALCGKTWTPTRDPEKYPICKTCADIIMHAKDRG